MRNLLSVIAIKVRASIQERCDGSDGRAAAAYQADLDSNLAVSGSILDPLKLTRE